MKTSFILCASFFMLCTLALAENCVPTQIHLSLAASNSTNVETLRYDSVRVNWVTAAPCTNTTLEWDSYEDLVNKGENSPTGMILPFTAQTVSTQLELGTQNRTSWNHFAIPSELQPRAKYVYRIRYPLDGGYTSVSDLEIFTAPHVEDSTDPVHMVFYADMGNSFQGSLTVQSLLSRHFENPFDLIMHVGDFAYDLATDDSQSADIFFEQVKPILSKVPMQGIPGNHEWGPSLVQYKQRVLPPQLEDVERIYYSFKIKNVYIINIVTQFLIPHQEELAEAQQAWLEEELTKAEADPSTSFIIVNGHRPLYCSRVGPNCGPDATFLRSVMEESFKKHKVDLYIGGHLHNYERTYPVFKGKVMADSVTKGCYINPHATTYIVSGSAGNEEFMLPTPYAPDSFSATVKVGISYSELTVFNDTHVYFEEKSSSQNSVIDSFWIIREPSEDANKIPLDAFNTDNGSAQSC